MKILAIRGANLASLAGDFCLDFQQGPLASTGLFAITGPTGSGKSTILDALCLALYGEYPRLAANSSEKLEDLSGHTLSAGDERNILARGAAGAFAEVDFVGLDGVAYRSHWEVRRAKGKSDGKLQASKVSLTRLVDQFVLADLKTDCSRRVEELSGLSFDQFCRTALLSQGRFDAFLLANQGERSDLLEKITGTEIYSELSRQAHAESSQRKADWDSIQVRIAGLQLLSEEEVAALRAVIGEREAESQQAAEALATTQAQLQLRQNEANAEAVAARTAAQLAATQEEDLRLAPARARLDALQRVETLRPRHFAWRQAEQSLTEKKAELELASHNATKRQDELILAQAALDAAQQAANAANAEIERWRPQWEAASAADQQLQQAEQDFLQARSQRDKTARELTEQQNEANRLKQQAEQAENDFQSLHAWLQANQALAGLSLAPIESLLQERASFAGQSFPVADLSEVARELASINRAAEEQRKGDAEARRAQLAHWQIAKLAAQEKEEAATALTQLNSQLTGLDAQLTEAQRALNLAQLSADEQTVALRSALTAGEPCPVCGATEHPYAGQSAALHQFLTEQQQRVQALQAGRDEFITQIGEQNQRASQAETRLSQALKAAGSLPENLDLDAESQQAELTWREATERLVRHEQLSHHSRFLRNQQNLTQLLAPLGASLASVEQNPKQWLSSLRASMRDFARKQEQYNEVLSTKGQASDQASAAATRAQILEAQRQEQNAALQAAEATLSQHRQTRSQLLNGELLATHRQPLLDRQQQAAEVLQRAEVSFATARANRDSAQNEIGLRQQGCDAQALKKEEAESVWLAACAQARLTPNDAISLLEATDKPDLLQQISAMDQRLHKLKGAHEQAVQQLIAAQKETSNLPSLLELAARVEELHLRRDNAQRALGAERQKLTDHERRLTESAALREQEEAARQQYTLWREISDAIGSADGKKFRNFVQALTLDHLIYRANDQLSRLAPRYRLERTNDDSLGLVIIDSEMADSRRATNSLSGGERFLVSLGLALGLARLEGRDSFVDSLFIDEGFGTLDPESLDQVMAALEALPSTGRRVGVISHVEAMKERIAVQVEVRKRGNGRSTLQISDRGAIGYSQP